MRVMTIVGVVALVGAALFFFYSLFGSSEEFTTNPAIPNKQLSPSELLKCIEESKRLRDEGEPRKAIEILKEALKREPNNPDLNIELGLSYEKTGEFDLAIKSYEKAISSNPRYYLPYKLLGSIYLGYKNETLKAKNYLAQSLRLNPAQPDVTALLKELEIKTAISERRPPTQKFPTVPRPPQPKPPFSRKPEPRPPVPRTPTIPNGNK